MWVDSSYRNKGIGKILFNSHRDWAKRLNIKFIKLWVENSENGAKNFYAKLGFIETGIIKPHAAKTICEMQFDL